MQPLLIKVNVPQKASFSINRYCYADRFPGIWHFHDEYELTLIEESTGSRMVGDHIERFKAGDLVFIGKNLPHTWRNDEPNAQGKSEALVIHFLENFLGAPFFDLPEMHKIKNLLERSRRGIKIEGVVADQVATLMKRIETTTGVDRVLDLLLILKVLSEYENLDVLSSEGFTNSINYTDSDRLKRVYEYIMNNFQEDVSLSKAASVAHMSPTAFSRYFKGRTRKPYTQFVIEMKIGYACKLLINEKMSVAEVCYQSGFQNLSNFNQQFKSITNLTPKKYQSMHAAK
ncbi:AraC family transcriptional regulator [Chitinophaga defluvii]|uniref:AraC family transcriptional regulator n=1 Tax=Chitinophaga defluvii TaxID=3163343 RepID=A0ABV2T7X0_9BACT